MSDQFQLPMTWRGQLQGNKTLPRISTQIWFGPLGWWWESYYTEVKDPRKEAWRVFRSLPRWPNFVFHNPISVVDGCVLTPFIRRDSLRFLKSCTPTPSPGYLQSRTMILWYAILKCRHAIFKESAFAARIRLGIKRSVPVVS